MAEEDTDYLSEARLLTEELQNSLPSVVPAADLTLESRLPFKATSVRELLIHRVADLASAAMHYLDRKRVVPASILTRSIVETVAVLFCLNQAIEQFLESPDEDKIDKFLVSSLVGARWEGHPVQSINVLTLIDRVTKTVPAFRSSYDNLSEYAHPNWSGLLGSYGTINHESHELRLGIRDRSSSFKSAGLVLSSALLTFKHYYNLSADNLKAFNDYYESRASSDGT